MILLALFIYLKLFVIFINIYLYLFIFKAILCTDKVNTGLNIMKTTATISIILDDDIDNTYGYETRLLPHVIWTDTGYIEGVKTFGLLRIPSLSDEDNEFLLETVDYQINEIQTVIGQFELYDGTNIKWAITLDNEQREAMFNRG